MIGAVVLVVIILLLVGAAYLAGRDQGPPWRGGDGPPGTISGGQL